MENSSSLSSFSRWGLVFLGLFPCLISLGFHLAGPAAAPVPPAKERSAITFDQYAVNRGLIQPMALADARFRFTNISDRPVKITALRPSCGCLVPRLEKRDYLPGETGMFVVQVQTAGEQPGPHHYTITMEYLDPEPRSVVLTFRMELPPRQIYITPRSILVYQFGEQPVKRDIVVSDNRLNPAKITGVECSATFVSPELAGTHTDNAGVTHSKIGVTINSVPAGVHNTVVKIRTNDPEFAVLSIPVRVHKEAFKPMTGARIPTNRSDANGRSPVVEKSE